MTFLAILIFRASKPLCCPSIHLPPLESEEEEEDSRPTLYLPTLPTLVPPWEKRSSLVSEAVAAAGVCVCVANSHTHTHTHTHSHIYTHIYTYTFPLLTYQCVAYRDNHLIKAICRRDHDMWPTHFIHSQTYYLLKPLLIFFLFTPFGHALQGLTMLNKK